jgi:hypothetical protein
MPELRTGAEARSPKERHMEARRALETRSVEARAQRAVDGFKGLLEIGSYTVDDLELIQAALKTGRLSAHEARIANRMIEELEAQRSFAAGYERGAAR